MRPHRGVSNDPGATTWSNMKRISGSTKNQSASCASRFPQNATLQAQSRLDDKPSMRPPSKTPCPHLRLSLTARSAGILRYYARIDLTRRARGPGLLEKEDFPPLSFSSGLYQAEAPEFLADKHVIDSFRRSHESSYVIEAQFDKSQSHVCASLYPQPKTSHTQCVTPEVNGYKREGASASYH